MTENIDPFLQFKDEDDEDQDPFAQFDIAGDDQDPFGALPPEAEAPTEPEESKEFVKSILFNPGGVYNEYGGEPWLADREAAEEGFRVVAGGLRDLAQELFDVLQATSGVPTFGKEATAAMDDLQEQLRDPELAPLKDDELNLKDLLAGKVPANRRPKTVQLPEVEEPHTPVGRIGRDMVQFAGAFIPALNLAKGVTGLKMVRGMTAGAFADAFGFDEREANLSKFVQDHPTLANPITEFLATNPEDSTAVAKLKNVLEGAALGAPIDAFLSSLKLMRWGKNKFSKTTAAERALLKSEDKDLARFKEMSKDLRREQLLTDSELKSLAKDRADLERSKGITEFETAQLERDSNDIGKFRKISEADEARKLEADAFETQLTADEKATLKMERAADRRFLDEHQIDNPPEITLEKVQSPLGSPQMNMLDAPISNTQRLLNPVAKAYMEAVRSITPIEKASKVLGDQHIANVARVTLASAENTRAFLEFGGHNAITKKATGSKSLVEIMKLPTQKHTVFNKYLLAKHHVEDLHPRGINKGQQIEESQKMVLAGEADDEIITAAQDTYRLLDDVIQYAVDSELKSLDDLARIKAVNKFYVPMFNAGQKAPTGITGAASKIIRQPIQRITGSDGPVVAPIRSIVNQMARVIQASDINRLVNSIAKHEGVPNADQIFILGKTKKAAPDDLMGVLETAEEVFVKDLPKNAPSNIPSNFKTINFFQDGVEREIFMDPDVARAIGAYSNSNTDDVIRDVIVRTLSLPAQALRAGTVDMPAFALVKNPIRDAFTVGLQSKEKSTPGLSMLDGLMSLASRSEVYKTFVRSGGSGSTRMAMDLPQMRKMFRQMMTPDNAFNWREVGETVMTPIRVAQMMTQALEKAPKIGEFKQGLRAIGSGKKQRLQPRGSLQQGLENATPEDLARLATEGRDVNVDFGVRGASKLVNDWSKVTAFGNATLQGTDKFIRMHTENPAKAVALGVSYLTIPSVGMLAFQMKSEKFRERYRELPNWRKVLFWNFEPKYLGIDDSPGSKWEGRLVGVPIPFEWGMIYKAIGETAVADYALNDPGVWDSLGDQLINTAQPFVNVDNAFKFQDGPINPSGSIRFNYPTAIQPFIDIGANRNTFYNTPIHGTAELELPSELRAGPNTSQAAITLSSLMSGVYSPKEIETLTNAYFGSLGRTVSKRADPLVDVLRGGEKRRFGDVPALKAFAEQPVLDFLFSGVVSRTAEEGASQPVSDFWAAYDDTIKQVNAFDSFERDKNITDLARFKLNNPIFAKGKLLQKFEPEIMDISRKISITVRNQNIPEPIKKTTLLNLNRARNDLAKIALKQLRALESVQ